MISKPGLTWIGKNESILNKTKTSHSLGILSYPELLDIMNG